MSILEKGAESSVKYTKTPWLHTVLTISTKTKFHLSLTFHQKTQTQKTNSISQGLKASIPMKGLMDSNL